MENILIPETFKFEQHDQNNLALIGLSQNSIITDPDIFNFEIEILPKNQKPKSNFKILGYSSEVKQDGYQMLYT